MASLRQLPSGSYQASVLMDTGKRTTVTRPTMAEALEWAHETEQARDAARAEQRALNEAARPAAVISTLRQLVHDGLITDEHRFEIVNILREEPSK